MAVDGLMALSPGESLRQPQVRSISIYRAPEEPPLENPLAPAGGVFDLSFVVGWLLPLAVVAAAHSVVSADRQQGTWPLIAATSSSPATVVATRLTCIAGPLTAATVAAGLVAVWLSAPVTDVAAWFRWLAWALVVTGYGLFWSLAVGAVSLGSSTAAASLTAAGLLWVTLTWVVPGVVDAVIVGTTPPPNPVAAHIASREIQRDIEGRLPAMQEAIYTRRPEWRPTPAAVTAATTPVPGGPASRDARRVFVPTLAAAEVAAPFERAATDRRDRTEAYVRRWSAASPALAVQALADHFAGTSAIRFVLFDRHVAERESAWQAFFAPRIMRLLEMTRSDMDEVPLGAPFSGQVAARQLAWPAAGLLVWIVAAVGALRVAGPRLRG